MTRFRLLLIGFCCSAAIAAAGVRRAPTITGVTPDPAPTSQSAQTITVSGRDFVDRLSLAVTGPDGNARVYADNAVTTRRESSFAASVFLTVPGAYRLVVTNPDGAVSNAFTLTARSAATAPVISGIKPLPISKSTNSQTITVEGSRFVIGLTVMVTDPTGSVQTIPASAIAQVEADHFSVPLTLELSGNYELVVVNPNGQSSNSFGFKVDGK